MLTKLPSAARQAVIRDRLAGQPGVSNAHLARGFGGSEMTIRRDLDALQERSQIQRTHGGGVLTERMMFEFAIGNDGAIYNPDLRLARVDKLMRRIAKRSCLLTDHTRIGRTELGRSGTPADVDVFITDSGAPSAASRRFAKLGPKILTAIPEK